MNARVFLLVLVTGAFMAVWDADRPTSTTNGITGIQPDPNALAGSQIRPALIPLPTVLLSGTWQVFNHDGDTLRITIEDKTPVRKSGTGYRCDQERVCVVTGSDGIRWCFIREAGKVAVGAGAITQ